MSTSPHDDELWWNDTCGLRDKEPFESNQVKGRIADGLKANEGEYPWFGSFVLTFEDKSSFLCGSSLINAQWLLTAAHCCGNVTHDYLIPGSELKIYIGAVTRYDTRGAVIVADKCIKHPNYQQDRFTSYADIGLIRIRKSDQLSKPRSRPYKYNSICLPTRDLVNETQVQFEIAGMGKIKTYEYTDDLYKGRINYTPGTCDDWAGNDTFCKLMVASAPDQKEPSTCNGDSGGPLMWKSNQGNDNKVYLVWCPEIYLAILI